MIEQTDEELMLSFQKGNSRAFEKLYQRYQRGVHGYIYKKIANPNYSDDVFQNVWEKVIKGSKTYQSQDNRFAGWLYAIINNTITDHQRKKDIIVTNTVDDDSFKDKHQKDLDENNDCGCDIYQPISPEDYVSYKKVLERFEHCLTRLPEEQKEIYLLKQEFDKTVNELAKMINESYECAKTRLRNARDRLKDCLDVLNKDY